MARRSEVTALPLLRFSPGLAEDPHTYVLTRQPRFWTEAEFKAWMDGMIARKEVVNP